MPDAISAAEVASLLDEWLATIGVGAEPDESLISRTTTLAASLEALNTYTDYDAIHNRLYGAFNDALTRMQQDLASCATTNQAAIIWARVRTETLPAIIRAGLGADEMAPPDALLPLIEESKGSKLNGSRRG